jgi:hypothetical protein
MTPPSPTSRHQSRDFFEILFAEGERPRHERSAPGAARARACRHGRGQTPAKILTRYTTLSVHARFPLRPTSRRKARPTSARTGDSRRPRKGRRLTEFRREALPTPSMPAGKDVRQAVPMAPCAFGAGFIGRVRGSRVGGSARFGRGGQRWCGGYGRGWRLRRCQARSCAGWRGWATGRRRCGVGR